MENKMPVDAHLKTQLFVASIKATGGYYEGQEFESSPKETAFEAFQDLQAKAHQNGISANWNEVQLDTFELSESTVTNPAVTFAAELRELEKAGSEYRTESCVASPDDRI